ncbi:MAG TPA: DUF6338 family protein [Mycobacteriales bacterium]|jgi:hypothetical protein|nr:DUF6338 family protein [Mycobacteriales bacterium]
MPPSDARALLVLLVAVLPGSAYLWAFERHAGPYGVDLADRVLRFVAVSVAFDVLYAWPAYALYRVLFADRPVRGGQLAAVWVATVVGLALPTLAGTLVGGLYATRFERHRWRRVRRVLTARWEARLLAFAVGSRAKDRAWDHAFGLYRRAYVRVRTRDGEWLGGFLGGRSHTGPFPHDTDLLIEQAWPVDADGTFASAPAPYAVYVPAGTIQYVEILRPSGSGGPDGQ